MYIGHNMTSTLTLTYNKKIKGHSVSGLFVYEQFESLGSTLGASRTNFPFTSIDQLFAGGDDEEQSNWGNIPKMLAKALSDVSIMIIKVSIWPSFLSVMTDH